MKPRRAMHFADGRVIVLNICGEQIPELCGDWVDVHQRVVERSDGKTHFEWIDGKGTAHRQDAESW